MPALRFLIAGLGAQEGEFEREFIFVDDDSTDDSAATLRALARLGFVRAAAGAWAWARRRGGKGSASREFALVCGARLGLLPPTFGNLHATCRAFAETNSVRIPPADPKVLS